MKAATSLTVNIQCDPSNIDASAIDDVLCLWPEDDIQRLNSHSFRVKFEGVHEFARKLETCHRQLQNKQSIFKILEASTSVVLFSGEICHRSFGPFEALLQLLGQPGVCDVCLKLCVSATTHATSHFIEVLLRQTITKGRWNDLTAAVGYDDGVVTEHVDVWKFWIHVRQRADQNDGDENSRRCALLRAYVCLVHICDWNVTNFLEILSWTPEEIDCWTNASIDDLEERFLCLV
jgi:hypothetical protein